MKATVLEGLAAAGLLTMSHAENYVHWIQQFGLSRVVEVMGNTTEFMEASSGAALLLAATVTAGISIMKKIKKNFETKKAMAKYISAKAEGLDEEDANIVTKSKDWYQAQEGIYERVLDETEYKNGAEVWKKAGHFVKKAYRDDFEDGDKIM